MSMGSNHVRGERLRTVVSGKTKVKRSFQKECDINVIMASYQKTGAIAHFNRHQGDYGVHSGLDFAESMRIVTDAQAMFDDLPSSIRTKFANDPALFMDFVQDEDNLDEMVELGLMKSPGAGKEAKPIVQEEVVKTVEEDVEDD